MSLDLGVIPVVNAAGSAVVLALGLYVARVRPRRRANTAFAAFSILWGYTNIVVNLARPDDAFSMAVWGSGIAAYALAGAALLLVGLWFPRRLARWERRLLRLPLGMALFILGGALVLLVSAFQDFVAAIAGSLPPLPPAVLAAMIVVDFSFTAVFIFLLLLLPLRSGAAAPQSPERRQLPVVGAAMALYPGMVLGHQVPCTVSFECILAFGISLLPFATAAALWLRNASQAQGAEARSARNAALATLGAVVAGGLAGAAFGGPVGPQFGLARLLMVALLAYAILRHQLFDIDLRLKRTLRQSAVTGAFVGVFILAAGGARFSLASDLSSFVGIAAAALLLVAIGPVQRAAARVADAAMPGVSDDPAYLDARKLDVYRAALEEALSLDGAPLAREAETLATLRVQLGITAREHAVLEHSLRAGRHAAPRAPQPGDEVAGYRVVRPLGEGSYGRAYLAQDADGHPFVVKVLRPERAADPAVLREARAIGGLRHPNIVRLQEARSVGSNAVLVMEYVDGGSLRDRLARGPLEREEFHRVALDTLSALEAVHASGMVHRDVKPSNLLMTKDGHAKLGDFGVARLPGFETTVGGPGVAIGTVQYMSPEVAKGKPATPRSDLFSLAATLYEALTGKAYLEPRANESAVELQMRAARSRGFHRPLPGPPALRAWFARALHPDPARRFASAAAMRQALLAAAPLRSERP